MTKIDIFIIIIMAIGAVMGFTKGLVRQLASMLGLVAGLIAARGLYASLAEQLCPSITNSMTVAQILSFLIIWIVVPLLFSVAATLITRALDAFSLGFVNRWLGSGLGAIKYLLVVSLVICVIEYIDSNNKIISETNKNDSLFYYPMEKFAGIFFPTKMNVTQQHITNESDATRRTQ